MLRLRFRRMALLAIINPTMIFGGELEPYSIVKDGGSNAPTSRSIVEGCPKFMQQFYPTVAPIPPMNVSSSDMPTPSSPGVEASTPRFVINRPEGRDKQKKKKRGTPDSSNEAWQKSMADLVENSNTHARLALAREEREKAREEWEKVREAREKQKHDEAIMSMDLSQFSPRTKGWYQRRKDAIINADQVDPSTIPGGSYYSPYDHNYDLDM